MKLIQRILGWRNWAVFTYNAFIEHIFLVFYIALITHNYTNTFIVHLFFFYAFSVFSTSYGYLINDLSDRELDARHGKPNVFGDISAPSATMIVLLVFVISALFTYPFWFQPGFLLLWGLWLFSATFYSLKPIRLKERGAAGLVVVVTAQRLLPTLLVFSAFSYMQVADVLLFALYIFLRGFASDINHQLEDYELDARTGTQTFAVSGGYRKTRRWFHRVLEMEKVMLLLVLTRIGYVLSVHYGDWYRISWLLLAIYLPLYVYSLWRIHSGDERNPFLPDKKNVFQFVHHPFPTIVLPVFLMALLIPHNRWYILILFVFVLNKRLLSLQVLANSYPVVLVRKLLTR